MGGHGHGGGGGGHGGGGGGWRGGWGWGGGGFPTVPYYTSSLIDPIPLSSFYRGYVITQTDEGYSVSKAADTAILATFGSQGEARAFIDSLAGVSGLGDGVFGAGIGPTIALGAVLAYILVKNKKI